MAKCLIGVAQREGHMLKIHTIDGRTTTLKLDDSDQARHALKALKQDRVTGFTLARNYPKQLKCPACKRCLIGCCTRCGHPLKGASQEFSVNYSLSRPEGFGRVCYQAEHIPVLPEAKLRGGECAICFAGDFAITLVAHQQQPAAKVTLKRLGKQRYNPLTE